MIGPTVQEADGLALSSRNARLSPEERDQASCLFLALGEAAELSRSGEPDARVLVAAMAREVGATPLARLDYAAVVDDATFEQVEGIGVGRPVRALIAAGFPSARLIDNLLLPTGVRQLSAHAPVGHDGPSFRVASARGDPEAVLLAADVGNTEIVLGVFRGAELEHTWRLSTLERTSDELALTLSGCCSSEA